MTDPAGGGVQSERVLADARCMKSLQCILVGIAVCVALPCLARAEEWAPLGTGMRWSYRITGVNKQVIAGREQTQAVRGTRNVEVRDITPELPQSPYEVVDTRLTRTQGQPGTSRETQRVWMQRGKWGLLGFGEEFPNPLAAGARLMMRYSPPLQLLPADPRRGQKWHVGVAQAVGLRIDLTGEVIGTRDVKTVAGLHRGCLEVRYTGSISGHIDSQGVRLHIHSGSLVSTSYYAPALGKVLEQEHFKMNLRMPDGQIVRSSARTDYVLESSSLPPSAPASPDHSQRR